MSQTRRYQTDQWCLDVTQKPWFIDVLTYVLVALWMGWTFTTIQQSGPSLLLLVSAVVVLAVGLLLIYNQRLAYLRIGDTIVLGTREMAGENEPERIDTQHGEDD